MKRYYSIGDIQFSKFWLSLELRPNCGHCFSIGKTYNQTRTGIVFAFGIGVIIGHIR